jgi:hypothetical protein
MIVPAPDARFIFVEGSCDNSVLDDRVDSFRTKEFVPFLPLD